MIKVGIVGATGYTGVELLRLLTMHQGCELVTLTSRSEAGRPVIDLFPNLRGHLDLSFVEPGQLQSATEVLLNGWPASAAGAHAAVMWTGDLKLQWLHIWQRNLIWKAER